MIKVLWTVNILFPEAKFLMGKGPAELASSGGWLIGAADTLCQTGEIELHIACPADIETSICLQGKRIYYHLFPGLQKSGEPLYGDHPTLDSVFRSIVEEVQPDIIDIHGTEYAHSISCLRAAGNTIPCAVTLQGLLYECAKHYHDGLSTKAIRTHKRLFSKGILEEEKSFRIRGKIEKKLLSQATHFIGRTTWDKECVLRLNPNAHYHICNETLREVFYEGCWNWETCEKQSIFLSQGSYPLKGLHQMLKALPAIIQQYPDTMLYIGGGDIVNCPAKRRNNYGRILFALMKEANLFPHIHFTGMLDAQAMKTRFLKANVFVCPSSIENSSNSLGEAQLLGVPCIAAARGGMPTIVPDSRMGLLYDFDDIDALARCVCQIFDQAPSFDNGPMREMARSRHDKWMNATTLVEIYKDILAND